jgi:transposase, IS5 family
MQRQGSFSQAEYAGKKKQTRRDKFLAEMEQVVPWSRLVARLQPLYPKGERGRPPIGLERMLRIYFLQQWYGRWRTRCTTAKRCAALPGLT